MGRERLAGELLLGLGLVALSTCAFTQKQRDWVKERDGEKCKAPFPHPEGGQLEVHHIIPQRYAQRVAIPDVDIPTNAITLCANGHDVIHPDRIEARKNYGQAKQKGEDSFATMFEQRKKKLDDREIYWNDEHDRVMGVIALRQTQTFQTEHPEEPFPQKRKK